jgi:hypothetical protein
VSVAFFVLLVCFEIRADDLLASPHRRRDGHQCPIAVDEIPYASRMARASSVIQKKIEEKEMV